MFRSIRSSVGKREIAITKTSESQTRLDRLIQEFLEKKFGDSAKFISVTARLDQQKLFLKTSNKTSAQEIIFQSGELYQFLKTNSIHCTAIVVQ